MDYLLTQCLILFGIQLVGEFNLDLVDYLLIQFFGFSSIQLTVEFLACFLAMFRVIFFLVVLYAVDVSVGECGSWPF